MQHIGGPCHGESHWWDDEVVAISVSSDGEYRMVGYGRAVWRPHPWTALPWLLSPYSSTAEAIRATLRRPSTIRAPLSGSLYDDLADMAAVFDAPLSGSPDAHRWRPPPAAVDVDAELEIVAWREILDAARRRPG